MMSDETETACPEASMTFDAHDGKLVMTFREAADEPEVTITFGYTDCEMLRDCITEMRRRRPFDFMLRQDAVKCAGRLLFGTVKAKRGRVQFEVAAPFGLAGWRWDVSGAELRALEIKAAAALAQEDAKP